MPTFCRHNRFIERCPICRETVPGLAPAPSSARRRAAEGGEGKPAAAPRSARAGASRRSTGTAQRLKIYREGERSADDGFRSPLTPGLRSSADGERLAREIAFAAGRLSALESDPPGTYGEARTEPEIEEASWICLLTVYLSPLEAPDPFVGISAALAPPQGCSWSSGELPDLEGIPLGPLSAHDPARGSLVLGAYRQWAARSGSQAAAFMGDGGWTAARRFERIFERLSIPGLGRFARYELLLTLGRLGVYELAGESLQFATPIAAGRGSSAEAPADPTLAAAKRVFGIGDPINLERRARSLAEEASVPAEALNLALANWDRPEPVTLGFPADVLDEEALARAFSALGL